MEFLLKKVWKLAWYVLTVYATIGGCMATTPCAYWALCLMKMAFGACCKSPVAKSKFSADMLLELMGYSNHTTSAPARKGGVCFTRRKGSDGVVKLGVLT